MQQVLVGDALGGVAGQAAQIRLRERAARFRAFGHGFADQFKQPAGRR